MKNTALKKHVRAIREQVETTHWIKNAYFAVKYLRGERKECACLAGLINREEKRSPATYFRGTNLIGNSPLAAAFFEKIKEMHPRTTALTIENWNDQSRRKREDVLAVCDALLGEKG